jgi:hypothetical protein
MKKLTVTQERINTLRVINNQSIEELAAGVGVHVILMKMWCGQRLTFREWLEYRVKHTFACLFCRDEGGG